MAPGDDRMSSGKSKFDGDPGPAELRERRRSLFRSSLVTLVLVAVVALIAIGIVRIVQS
jgi:hypothetical protein